ncbi:hypothetical protein V5F53_08050 [Xanthobacter sp. V4C-4]|uniref:hypothetical protein n=1 Tax=Xanthobacter cornucopiae TaxID=3119924 RepID=UPI00372A8EFA
MRMTVRARFADGLAARLAGRALPDAAERAAARAADELARQVEAATGVRPHRAGLPGRPLVRVAEPAVLARVRGEAGREGDPVLDRVRLAFARTRRAGRADDGPGEGGS